MTKRIMLIPVGSAVGLTSVSLGLLRAFEQKNIDVGFLNQFHNLSQAKMDRKNQPKLLEKPAILSRLSHLI